MDFEHHVALGRLWLHHALILSDSIIIPFNLTAYAKQVLTIFIELEHEYSTELKKYNVTLDFAKNRINALVTQAARFDDVIRTTPTSKLSDSMIRAINDRLMHFEKNFILESEVGKQKLKHVIYSTKENFYGIVNAITDEPGENGDNIRKEVTLFVWCVDMATRSLDLSELRMDELLGG